MDEKDKKLYEKMYKKIRSALKLPRDKGLKDLDENKEKENWKYFTLYIKNIMME